MVTLAEQNSDGSDVDIALQSVADRATVDAQLNYTFAAVYSFTKYSTSGNFEGEVSISLAGANFSRNAQGFLVGGLINFIQTTVYGNLPGSNFELYVSSETYSGLYLPVSQAVALAGVSGGAAPTLLDSDDTITSNAPSVLGYAGDDTITLTGLGTNPAVPNTTVDGGDGTNTAVFPFALRSAAIVSGGGGNEKVVQSNLTSDLVSIQKMQFIDGTVYESSSLAEAQAALVFQGILGRLPDAINAGGYGQIARSSGLTATADLLLTKPEALADTAALSNADYVTRLYTNVLGRPPEPSALATLQGQLTAGTITRAMVAADIAASPEAQSVNGSSFSSGNVFGADPNAVEVLRAYEVLLNRLPEASSITANTQLLDNGAQSLAQLYVSIQDSPEFKQTSNGFGVNATSSFATIRSVVLSDPVTALVTPLVTSQGAAVHT